MTELTKNMKPFPARPVVNNELKNFTRTDCFFPELMKNFTHTHLSRAITDELLQIKQLHKSRIKQ